MWRNLNFFMSCFDFVSLSMERTSLTSGRGLLLQPSVIHIFWPINTIMLSVFQWIHFNIVEDIELKSTRATRYFLGKISGSSREWQLGIPQKILIIDFGNAKVVNILIKQHLAHFTTLNLLRWFKILLMLFRQCECWISFWILLIGITDCFTSPKQ